MASVVFSLNVNSKKVSFMLENLKYSVQTQIEKATRDGVRFFMGKVQKEQYSGRKSAEFGLNVRTGLLRRAWRVWSFGSIRGGNFAVKMVNNVIYGRIHQVGGWAGKDKRAYIPKRTYVPEDFQKSGKNIVIGKVSKELATLIERGLIK